jgi:hypothetical protein
VKLTGGPSQGFGIIYLFRGEVLLVPRRGKGTNWIEAINTIAAQAEDEALGRCIAGGPAKPAASAREVLVD